MSDDDGPTAGELGEELRVWHGDHSSVCDVQVEGLEGPLRMGFSQRFDVHRRIRAPFRRRFDRSSIIGNTPSEGNPISPRRGRVSLDSQSSAHYKRPT